MKKRKTTLIALAIVILSLVSALSTVTSAGAASLPLGAVKGLQNTSAACLKGVTGALYNALRCGKANVSGNLVIITPQTSQSCPSASTAPKPSASTAPKPSASAAPKPSVSATPKPSVSAAPKPSVSATPKPSVSAAPTPSPSTAPTSGLSELEQKMVDLVNGERAKAGLSPLKVNIKLTQMARAKSQDMIANNYFAHNSPTYGSPFDMMKTFGITYRTAGENIAMNRSMENAHTALMNSPGHRANILGASYTQIGIGIVSGGNGSLYISQEFIG